MKKDPKIFIDHILESIERIGEYLHGLSKEKFLNSKKTQAASRKQEAHHSWWGSSLKHPSKRMLIC